MSAGFEEGGEAPAAGRPRAAAPPRLAPVNVGFEPERPPRWKEAFARLVIRFVRLYAAVFRDLWPFALLWPVPRLFGLRLVVRHDHVREVLARDDVFEVPFGAEIARLNDGEAPGTPFLLGLDDRAAHGEQANTLMSVFRLADDIKRVTRLSFDCAQAHLGTKADARFDAIGDLLTAVPLDICERYFGVPLAPSERTLFARASIELSGHLFGCPPIGPSKHGRENIAGDYVRAVVDRAIDLAVRRAVAATPAAEGSVASRREKETAVDWLLREYGAGTDGRHHVRAVLIGMIVGFVPTNTMAGGYMLETLLTPRPGRKRPREMMEEASRAAASGDDDRLARCLFEALRFKPINLGPFRDCRRPYAIGGVTVRAGEHVLASTSAAMFDRRVVKKARRYVPERPASNHLHFGFGMHWCLGAAIARVQLTQTFKALLLREPGRASRLEYWGLFPYRLEVSINGR